MSHPINAYQVKKLFDSPLKMRPDFYEYWRTELFCLVGFFGMNEI